MKKEMPCFDDGCMNIQVCLENTPDAKECEFLSKQAGGWNKCIYGGKSEYFKQYKSAQTELEFIQAVQTELAEEDMLKSVARVNQIMSEFNTLVEKASFLAKELESIYNSFIDNSDFSATA